MVLKRSFFDEKGNRKLAPILVGITFFWVVLILDYIVRNRENIINYFSTMDNVIIGLLLSSIIFVSLIKVMYTHYDKNVDDFAMKIRLALDGSILLIATVISLMLLVGWISIKFEVIIILQYINNLLGKSIFITVISIIISVFIVLITYSMIENIYIILKILMDKLHTTIEDTKDVYSIFIAVLALIISILSFFI